LQDRYQLRIPILDVDSCEIGAKSPAAEHTNFFENRATEYSKASTQGTWEEVFSNDVFAGNYAKPADAA
jgi:hypothetical protein